MVVDYIAQRTNDVIKLMPFIIIIGSLILLEISKRVDNRRPSMFIMTSIIKVLCIPYLVFSPFLFIMTLSENAFFILITFIQYTYIFFMIAGSLILFLYMFEILLSKFMKIDLYMDGVKIRWGRLLK